MTMQAKSIEDFEIATVIGTYANSNFKLTHSVTLELISVPELFSWQVCHVVFISIS